MKKLLMVSTAIVGGSLLATGPAFVGEAAAQVMEPELTVSGYARVEAWFGDADDETTSDGRQGFMETDDAEIRFDGRATAENGLNYGVHMELDMDNNGTVDELNLFFAGDWGRLELGDQDGANDQMPYDGTFSLTAQGGYDGGAGSYFAFNGVTAGSPDMAGGTGDATKITYYTPRVGGAQVGISYTPDVGKSLSGGISAKDGDVESHVGLGANFVSEFNGVDVGIGGAIVFSDRESGGTTDDAEGIHVGFNIGYAGATLGAGYGNSGDTGVAAGAGDAGQWWEVAAGYSTGPWAAHIGFFHGEAEQGAGTADDETDFFTLGINYNVAAGLRVYAEYDHIEVEQAGSGAGFDNEGDLFMVGTNISF